MYKRKILYVNVQNKDVNVYLEELNIINSKRVFINKNVD